MKPGVLALISCISPWRRNCSGSFRVQSAEEERRSETQVETARGFQTGGGVSPAGCLLRSARWEGSKVGRGGGRRQAGPSSPDPTAGSRSWGLDLQLCCPGRHTHVWDISFKSETWINLPPVFIFLNSPPRSDLHAQSSLLFPD